MSGTMDFFEAQAAAHRTTLRLVGLFIGAVLALIALTVFLVAATIAFNMPPSGYISLEKIFYALSPGLILGIGGSVIGVVIVASVFRHLSLSQGGRAIAESLGGRQLQPNSQDQAERRLLNVVEEMAIAAGLPVPPVYVIDEEGINAFAAGYSPDDAVIGVTRGTLEMLDRDELQGVIGHEFSHILNGDMRLNIRLMSVLFGILVIGIIGRSLLMSRPRRGFTQSGSSRRGGGAAQVAVLGIALLIVGYIGTFFGNLIKAAVSRQREFLADASAVQFTRNPQGIAGALRKIGSLSSTSRIRDGRADEMSHMFFGPVSGVSRRLFSGLATHPPLEARIRAVDPAWDGNFPAVTRRSRQEEIVSDTDRKFAAARPILDPTGGALSDLPPAAGAVLGGVLAAGVLGGSAAGRIGHVTPDDVEEAHALIDGIPKPLYEASHDPYGARAMIYSLLLASDQDLLETQMALLIERAEPGVPELIDDLRAAQAQLPPGQRLTLLQLAMPALKTLSETQFRRFIDTLAALIRSDGSIHAFEWVLHQVLLKELRPHFEGVRRRSTGRKSLDALAPAAATLLSTVARAGQDDTEAARAAFAAAAAAIDLDAGSFEAETDPNMSRLSAAMRQLRELHPLAQPRLLKACIQCVLHNGRILDAERDLLHGVAAALDCPLPPLVAEH
ncbi:MAG: M48 family metallopeptidase [Gammaproteobacteria bacterium]|nr:M48 family metallopeptidase [Gammaproteobacteria bacterium]